MKNIFISAMILLSLFSAAQDKSQYDINDPRNPDCPCHKYQKLADEEYKKLTASAERKKVENRNPGRDEGVSSAENNGVPKDEHDSQDEGISSAENNYQDAGISEAEQIAEPGISESEKNGIDKGISENERIQHQSKGNLNGGEVNNSAFAYASDFKHKKTSHHKKLKKRKRLKKYPSWVRKLDYHNWDICKESRIVSACFHWH